MPTLPNSINYQNNFNNLTYNNDKKINNTLANTNFINNNDKSLFTDFSKFGINPNNFSYNN